VALAGDERVLFVWLTLGLPFAGAVWAVAQRGLSHGVVFGALASLFLFADLIAVLTSPAACCYGIVFCGLHGATAVLSARLADILAARRRARFHASVRRGLATFRALKRTPRSAYR
jgi:hypothetical protein